MPKEDSQAHIPALLEETIEGLALQGDSIVVDATLGSCGHARRVLETLGKKGMLIGIDADRQAIKEARKTLKGADGEVHLVSLNFRNIDEALQSLAIEHVDAIYADLGWRIEQYEEGKRGFSFKKDEPLLMTYGDSQNKKQYPFTAGDIINSWKEEDIANVLYGYGEERHARRIARKIIERREQGPIATARELGELIENSVPFYYRKKRIHPATKSFQALRIAVNDELGALEEFITKGIPYLTKGGRIAVLTFHSIEDRLVKKLFRHYQDGGIGKIITKKPITATEEEVAQNPRARSAKLRVLEKT